MNCEQYQEQISQFIDGELLPTAETELFVHLGVCEHCRTFLKNTLSLRNIFASAQQIAIPASLDQQVLDQNSSVTKKAVHQNFVWRFTASAPVAPAIPALLRATSSLPNVLTTF